MLNHPIATLGARAHGGWTRRPAVRWLATFAGFPLGAVLARALVGPVDTTAAALIGGAVNGAAIGLVQGWALRPLGVPTTRWAAATALGLMVGLGLGATAVGFSTTPGALAVQGLICGLAVGAAQAAVLARFVGPLAAAWPPVLGSLWTIGWSITTAIGVDVERQYTVFGSSGAVTVTLLSVVLPVTLARRTVES